MTEEVVKSSNLDVQKTYNTIAVSFDKTRYSVWNCVKLYVSSIANSSSHKKDVKILEVGCGNGKNLAYLQSLGFTNVMGCDVSSEFVSICNAKNINAIECDILNLQNIYQRCEFSNILCIAVLHHLNTEEKRRTAVCNMFDLLDVGGTIIITVSSAEKPFSKHSKKLNDFHDYAVDWNNTGVERFYHLFVENELETLCKSACGEHNMSILSSSECGNWIVVITKH